VARFRVSSSQLTKSSAFFRRLLSITFREGNELKIKGYITIELKNDSNIEACETVLKILHGQISEVQHDITTYQLAEIVILADYYDCITSLKTFVYHCIGRLKEYDGFEVFVPAKYGFDTRLRIFVAWVFAEDLAFSKAMGDTIRACNSGFDVEYWLPLPGDVMGTQNISRY
jgi:hypothetical protein